MVYRLLLGRPHSGAHVELRSARHSPLKRHDDERLRRVPFLEFRDGDGAYRVDHDRRTRRHGLVLVGEETAASEWGI